MPYHAYSLEYLMCDIFLLTTTCYSLNLTLRIPLHTSLTHSPWNTSCLTYSVSHTGNNICQRSCTLPDNFWTQRSLSLLHDCCNRITRLRGHSLAGLRIQRISQVVEATKEAFRIKPFDNQCPCVLLANVDSQECCAVPEHCRNSVDDYCVTKSSLGEVAAKTNAWREAIKTWALDRNLF